MIYRRQEGVRLVGRVRVVTQALDGRALRDTGWRPNQIVNGGAAALAAWLTGTINQGTAPSAVPYPAFMELGSGTTTPAPTDTDLANPNVATYISVSQSAPVAGSLTIAQWVGVWGPQYGPYNATECGLFNSDGTLFSRLLATVDLSADTTTTLQWQWVVQV